MKLTRSRCLLLAGLLAGTAATAKAQEAAPQAPEAAPQGQTPAPTMTHYKPPAENRWVEDNGEPRNLLAALRAAGDSVRSTWTQRRSQELGSSTVVKHFERLYTKESIDRLTADFREGYVQVFVEVPAMMQVSAVEMATPESAAEFCRMNMETLQGQLDQTAQVEETRLDVLHDVEMTLEGIDKAYEKRYELAMGDMPPSRFYTLFAVAGRHMITTTFLQMEVDPETAHGVLIGLAARLQGAAGN